MKKAVNLIIDGVEVTVPAGTTILDAAAQAGIEIPVICYHPHLTANGLCRICCVDTGGRVQVAACVSECQDAMVVNTGNDAVRRNRKTILEMLASTVELNSSPDIQSLIEEYQADTDRFSSGKRRESPIYDDNPFYIRDYNQCINCWRCVQVCAEDAQFTFALSFDGRGFDTKIGTFNGDGMTDTTCVFCGQCVGVCPTDALLPKREALLGAGYDPDDVFRQTAGGMRKIRKKKE